MRLLPELRFLNPEPGPGGAEDEDVREIVGDDRDRGQPAGGASPNCTPLTLIPIYLNPKIRALNPIPRTVHP